MTSVVDTSVKFVHSDMAGAPVLTGQAGSLIALLDAFLVTGFGLMNATSLVVSGGVATLAFSGSTAAEADVVIVVAGSSVAALNGEQRVTGKTAGTVTFATAAPDGAASGSITFKIAPLGWSKVYADTNKAAYKSNDPATTGCVLRVDDTDPQVARAVGFESMSSIDIGTGQFPLNSQVSGGLRWAKSYSANSNPVRYTLWGDLRAFFMALAARTGNSPSDAQYVAAGVRGFGDMVALRPSGDVFCCAISGNPDDSWQSYPHYGTFSSSAGAGLFMPRSWSGFGSSWQAYSRAYIGSEGATSGADEVLGTFPSPIDGSMRLSQRYLRQYAIGNTSDYAPRASIPGIYHVPHAGVYATLGYRAKIPGTGSLTGRKLLSVAVSNTYGAQDVNGGMGVVMIDITGPWR